MNRRTYLARLGAGGAATAALADPAAAQSDGNTTGDSSGGNKTHEIKMVTEGGEYYFDPVGLHVKPGDTVKWVIDSGGHTTTSYSKSNGAKDLIPKGAKGWDSGMLKKKGASFEKTFTVEGTYDYYCTPHKTLGMVGRIVCGEPGGPATEGEIPNKPGSGVMPTSDEIVKEGSLAYPYTPSAGMQPLPWQFWLGTGVFASVLTYLVSKYDRASGRYTEEHADNRL
ncbi:MAG: plastocyanin/azurin family copper-binding protein [Haloarculaceae archaeon]